MERKKISYGGPGKYIQASGIIEELPEYTSQYGRKPFILLDSFFIDEYSELLRGKYLQKEIECILEYFSGENNYEEVKRCCCAAQEDGADYVIAIGGGKTLDCGKYISHLLKFPFVSMPTTAATDAPCSALTIVYDGVDSERKVIRCDSHPSLVLVDSQIIANAPVRFLIAGIGDALATYFEALANERTGAENFVGKGCVRTRMSLSIAKTCYDILNRYARQAVRDAKKHKVSQSLEYVIEANILLSGLGFENTGCAGAHSISGGIGAIENCKSLMHGEKVAFGTLCQVYMENHGEALLNDLFDFCCELGLPVTLDDLGIVEDKEQNAKKIARASMNKFWDAEPVEVTVKSIQEALLTIDRLGADRKKEREKKGDV